jgi:hypothetical protein
VVIQKVKNFPAFYGTRRLNIMFTRTRQRILTSSWCKHTDCGLISPYRHSPWCYASYCP